MTPFFVDGPTLLFSEETVVMELLNVTDINHANALTLSLQSLKDYGVMLPQTIWEYKVRENFIDQNLF